jgi:formylglycine-generating enzyme required for sulfatase activity
MGNLFSGGTLGQCNGALGLDFNSWLSSNPTAFGSPFAQGQTIRAQGWYRDPAAPGQTNLSNAVAFTLCGTSTSNICVAPSGFVAIQPGTFQMGESGTATPVHAVTISYQFWMGAKEVTQAEYAALMGSSSSYFGGNTNRPVEQVTWSSARSYCSALTAQQAAQGAVPPGYEYRLPTEAEWEYACRAGTSTSFNIGDFLTCADANMYVNDFCIGQTSPVGSYAPNAWGLYDMHGNVAEWCLDSQTGYPSSAVTDPFGVGAIERAVRGGAWNYGVFGCRSAYRFFSDPSASLSNLGFRLVLGPIRIP